MREIYSTAWPLNVDPFGQLDSPFHVVLYLGELVFYLKCVCLKLVDMLKMLSLKLLA